MQTAPVILILPVLMPIPVAAGAIDDAGSVVQVLNQVREFHRDARDLGTFPADPQPATDYGRQCSAEAVRLCRERSSLRRIPSLSGRP